jgi:polyisoprenoid-binding protein YceI
MIRRTRLQRRIPFVLLIIIGSMSAGGWPVAGQAPSTTTKTDDKKPILKPGQIDPEKSRVYIHVSKKRLGHDHAIEGRIKSGSVNLKSDKSTVKEAGQIEFDLASFSADTDAPRKEVELKGAIAESTREQVTQTMLGSDVLDVEQFPEATFKIKSADYRSVKGSDPVYTLQGEFTLHGMTRPISLIAQSELQDGKVRRLRGDFTILQSDFGITPYKAALGTVGVADQLKIWGDIWIVVDDPNSKKKRE